MYRVGLEAILGFTKRGDTLTIEPRVPASWPSYTIEYRFGDSLYVITVEDPAAVGRGSAEASIDGSPFGAAVIPLTDDGSRHDVVVRPRR
jgi:cellobiose phosphorylase